jgi:hypothetical protein
MRSRSRSVGAAAGGACSRGHQHHRHDGRRCRRLFGAASNVTIMSMITIFKIMIMVTMVTTVTTAADTNGTTTFGGTMTAMAKANDTMGGNIATSAAAAAQVTA